MALLDDVKLSLRITTNTFDTEITDLIEYAQSDLVIAGVKQSIMDDFVAETDPTSDSYRLIKRAVTTYVKAEFGWDNPDMSDFRDSYHMQKLRITLIDSFITE